MTDQTKFCWVPCTIENSGFSSERRFETTLGGETGKVVGAAYIAHFLDGNKQPLPEGHPPYGEVINGFVRCRVIRHLDNTLVIEFPGTDVFHVPQEALADCLE